MYSEVRELEVKRDAIVIEDEDKVTNYYRIRQQLNKLEKEMQAFITKPIYCVPFLQPGRLVRVEHEDEDFGWGCVVNFQKKANQKVTFCRLYNSTRISILMCVHVHVHGILMTYISTVHVHHKK